LIAIGAGIGGLGAAAGIRASRNPDSWLYSMRAAAGAAPRNTSEAGWLERKYGPVRHSMYFEEWILQDFFRGKRNGVFVDVGSADYQDGSNTWFLENQWGWSGVAIDAQEQYRTGFEKHRPRTRFFALFVADRSNETVQLFLSAKPGTSSSQEAFSARLSQVVGSVDIATITLNDLLDAQGIKSIDFLSMDIELAEPKALAGLDIQRFKPQLAVVEAHPEVRQQILDYFAANQYVVAGKYLRVDDDNIWFMPAGSHVEPFPSEDKPEDWLR
jgi:FkbM family methyltransferase